MPQFCILWIFIGKNVEQNVDYLKFGIDLFEGLLVIYCCVECQVIMMVTTFSRG